jgi:hypothetical protein
MLSKRATLGLKVFTTIASAPSHRTITADTLASITGVSLSIDPSDSWAGWWLPFCSLNEFSFGLGRC